MELSQNLPNPHEYLAIDPGQKNTGWATFDELGQLTDYGKVVGQDKFLDWFEDLTPQPGIVIIERYRNRGGFTNSFSTMPTSQHIGAILRVCRKRKIPYVEQDPSPALAIGLRFLNVHTLYVGKHVPDEISALAHGTYYLRKKGVQK